MLQKYAITACTLFLLATCNSIGAEEANQFDHSLEELSRQFELDLLRVFESSQIPAESVEKQATITDPQLIPKLKNIIDSSDKALEEEVTRFLKESSQELSTSITNWRQTAAESRNIPNDLEVVYNNRLIDSRITPAYSKLQVLLSRIRLNLWLLIGLPVALSAWCFFFRESIRRTAFQFRAAHLFQFPSYLTNKELILGASAVNVVGIILMAIVWFMIGVGLPVDANPSTETPDPAESNWPSRIKASTALIKHTDYKLLGPAPSTNQFTSSIDEMRTDFADAVLTRYTAQRLNNLQVEYIAKVNEREQEFASTVRRADIYIESVEKAELWYPFILGTLFLPLAVAQLRRSRSKQLLCYACNAPTLNPKQNEPAFLICGDPVCGQETLKTDATYDRLLFSTVGETNGGKTQWLITLNDMVNRSILPEQWKLFPSLVPEVQEHLTSIMKSTQATGTGLVTPADRANNLPLTFEEHGILPSRKFIGICDYGGEWTGVREDTQVSRRRALASDGFLYFLDPTQSGDQYQRLMEFHSQLKEEAGVNNNKKSLDKPVAVVLSKIDLVDQGNDVFMDSLHETLTASTINLNLIYARSQYVVDHLQHIFPEWDVERRLREVFGEKYCFFPTSTVSITPNEDGVDEDERRFKKPIGVVEPLMWLLHMRGCRVFEADNPY
jgi:hypothetical protein